MDCIMTNLRIQAITERQTDAETQIPDQQLKTIIIRNQLSQKSTDYYHSNWNSDSICCLWFFLLAVPHRSEWCDIPQLLCSSNLQASFSSFPVDLVFANIKRWNCVRITHGGLNQSIYTKRGFYTMSQKKKTSFSINNRIFILHSNVQCSKFSELRAKLNLESVELLKFVKSSKILKLMKDFEITPTITPEFLSVPIDYMSRKI